MIMNKQQQAEYLLQELGHQLQYSGHEPRLNVLRKRKVEPYVGHIFRLCYDLAATLDENKRPIEYFVAEPLKNGKILLLPFRTKELFWRYFKMKFPDYKGNKRFVAFLYLHIIGEISEEQWNNISIRKFKL